MPLGELFNTLKRVGVGVIDLPLREALQLAKGTSRLYCQKRARPKLESDRANLGVIQPVFPFRQPPDAARHDDRRPLQTALVHHGAQSGDALIGFFRPFRIFRRLRRFRRFRRHRIKE